MNWPLFILSCVAGYLVIFLIERLFRWRFRRRISREMDNTLQQIKDGTYESEAEPSPIRLSWNAKGFTISDSETEKTVLVHWEKICRAEAFKRDLLAYDEVCVAFDLNGDSAIEINETMDGFTDLMEAAPTYLAGFVAFSDWYMNITTPAFETNLTPLFERQESEEDSQKGD